jgi:hypothetical protein
MFFCLFVELSSASSFVKKQQLNDIFFRHIITILSSNTMIFMKTATLYYLESPIRQFYQNMPATFDIDIRVVFLLY